MYDVHFRGILLDWGCINRRADPSMCQRDVKIYFVALITHPFNAKMANKYSWKIFNKMYM